MALELATAGDYCRAYNSWGIGVQLYSWEMDLQQFATYAFNILGTCAYND